VNEKEIMERWKEYFSELLNEQSEYQLDEVAKVEGDYRRRGEYSAERNKEGKSGRTDRSNN